MMQRLTALVTSALLVGGAIVGAPAPAIAADPPITYYVAQSGTAAGTPGDGTSCAAPDFVELPAGDDETAIISALTPASDGDTIYLCAGTYDIGTTIHLSGETITLQGAGAGTTILDGGSDTQILANSGAVTVSGLTFQNGSASSGGAIYSDTTVTVSSSAFADNSSTIAGGAIVAARAVVSGSLFNGNESVDGGAIYAASASVNTSVFTQNNATGEGGAIYVSGTQISSPITLNLVDRYITYTGVSINGGSNTEMVAPGASVTLSYSLSVVFNTATGYCPGCVVQLYLGVGSTSPTLQCEVHIPNGYSATRSMTFTAPTAPGVYFLTHTYGLAYACSGQYYRNVRNAAMGLIVVGDPITTTADVAGSTFTDNSAPQGGAIYTLGTVNARSTGFSGNPATGGESISYAGGGGIVCGETQGAPGTWGACVLPATDREVSPWSLTLLVLAGLTAAAGVGLRVRGAKRA
jgi:predicted outer membrane repeat protein